MEKINRLTAITFKVPLDGGHNYKVNECAEQIAQLLDLYFDTSVEDMDRINKLIDEEVVASMRREVRMNELDDINGGSK